MKGKALHEWVKGWNGLAKLNAIVTNDGDLAVVIEPGNTPLEEFIDGTARQSINFILAGVFTYSPNHDDINAQAQELMEEWREWVAAQDKAKNYPDFGEAVIESLTPVSIPYLAMVYEGMAKYQLAAEIIYTE